MTNQQFLEIIFGDQWRRALITGFRGDPDKPRDAWWAAYPAEMLPGAEIERDLNMYFCPSLTRGTKRWLTHFESFHVIVVDDYGTKITPGVPERVLGRRPSYVIETSPGNYQAGWLTDPVTDVAWLRRMLKGLRERLGAGDNLADPMAWRRLPVGMNGKPRHDGWRVTLMGEDA